jgi:PAS domain S-box-containing protein
VAKNLEQEKKFSEKVLSSLPGIFYLYGEDGNIVRWNKNHEILTGFSAEEISGRKIFDWFNEEEKKYIASRVEETFIRGKSDAEGYLVIKSGEMVPYYFTAIRMIIDNKKYLLGMGTDLSKLKKTEDALRKSEEKYRQIFEYAVEGIYQTTLEGRFVSANPAMANILGYDSPQSLIDEVKNIRKQLYVSQNDRDDFIRLIKGNQAVTEFEVQFYRKDEKKIWVSLHARPVYDAKGNLSIIEGFIIDITERKEATEALREREEYLRKENIRLRSNIKDRYKFGIFFGTADETVPDPYFNGKGPDRTGCTFCGSCMVGCPVGAKNTLDKNYLYLAEGLGAQIIPETEVTGVLPRNGGYDVFTRKSTGVFHPKKTLRARGVVFSGGVMGSVKLLMKCKQEGLLPNISDQLGNYVRTNSEALLGVKSQDKSIDWNDQIAITSGIYADDTTHIEMVRYNKGSDVLLNLFTVMTGGGGRIPRPLRFLGNIVRHPIQFLKLLWPLGKAATTTIVLVMQTDKNYLKLDYKPRWWRLGAYSMNSSVPAGLERSPVYIPVANEVAERLSHKMNGIPLSGLTEVAFNSSTTAHILGGCCMAESPDKGVIGYNGEIFGHPNLFVADGSVIPANLGVNPSLTITALSEHIMSQVPEKS